MHVNIPNNTKVSASIKIIFSKYRGKTQLYFNFKASYTCTFGKLY